MNQKLIEVELRAEIFPEQLESFQEKLEEFGVKFSSEARLSVMFFGNINNQKTDIRVRVTNGECEVAAKFGSFGSHDRIELVQKIEEYQFIGMTKIFSQFKFDIEIGERKTINYKLGDNIVVSLVSAGNIYYVELEKMSSESEIIESKKKLKKIADNLGLRVLDKRAFDILCKKLSDFEDWVFKGSESEYSKLENIFQKYKKTK